MKRLPAFALAALILAGCGGGGGNSVPAGSSKTQVKTVNGSVVLSIPVASTTTQSLKRNVRYPQFVSPNASSVSLSINGGAVTLYDVSTSSTLCTTVAMARNCTLTFGAPVGTDTFAFTVYSGANGTGSTLAVANSTQTIAAGTAFNFTVALNASVGTITVGFTPGSGTCVDAPMNFNGFNEGCAGSGPLTITVDDPSGAQITGSAPFATPLQITTNEPTITASPTTMTAPNQTVTISYAGGPWQSITNFFSVSVNAGGQTGSLLIPAEQSNLYVANSNAAPQTTPAGGGNIAVYRFGASGNAAPLRTLTGGITNPVQPMLDSSGKLWVLDNGPYTTYSSPYINVYAAGASGSATPIKSITNIAGLDYNESCETMAFTPNQSQLYVTCDDGAIHVFPTNFTGSVTATSLQTVSMQDDSWEGVQTGMAFDNSGNLYVADTGFGSIYQYQVANLPTSGAYQSMVSSHIMSGTGGSWPANVSPLALLVDNSGTLYASIINYAPAGAADANNQLAFWLTATIPCSNCVPSGSLLGGAFATHVPTGIIFDPVGNFYVANPFTNSITEYARATVAGAALNTNNPTVLRTLNTGASPGAPDGMAVGP